MIECGRWEPGGIGDVEAEGLNVRFFRERVEDAERGVVLVAGPAADAWDGDGGDGVGEGGGGCHGFDVGGGWCRSWGGLVGDGLSCEEGGEGDVGFHGAVVLENRRGWVIPWG